MTTIFYTVLLNEPNFPVRFISAGKLGTFRGPFADPGEASQEFQCCYAEGATEYVNPDDFAQRAAGLPEFLMPTGSAPGEQPVPRAFSLTEQENANFRAYIAKLEAEEARAIAAGEPIFAGILDKIRDDGSEFSSGMGDGYMCYWDQSGPRPEATAQSVYAFMAAFTGECSPEWVMGFACGWFAAFGESQPQADFTWQSGPPPSDQVEPESEAQ